MGEVDEWVVSVPGPPRPPAEPDASGMADVAGTRDWWASWGEDRSEPTTLLVHGAAAHSGWWHGIVPALVPHRRVVVLELSGHGRSGRRDSYEYSAWGAEIAEFVALMGLSRVEIVGHSLGGVVSSIGSSLLPNPAVLERLVLVDSRQPRKREVDQPRRGARQYETREEALGSFRLLPPQEGPELAGMRHLAETGIRREPSGHWVWRFDPRVLESSETRDLGPLLRSLSCPLNLIRGELSSVVSPRDVEDMRMVSAGALAVTEIEDAYHHPMLEKPQEFFLALSRVLGLGGSASPS